MLLFDHAGSTTPATRATALIARCASIDGREPVGREFARRLTVGDRESLLLQLLGLTIGNRLAAVLTCTDCGERMDLELNVGEMLSAPGDHEGWEHRATLDVDGGRYGVVFRLPNGGDQETGAALLAGGEERAVDVILRRCIRSLTGEDGTAQEEIPTAVAVGLSRRMAELDPQAELWIDTRCVGCGAAVRSLFDAAWFVLREAARGAESLFHEVHALAGAYHWREAEILAMSARRRHKYLDVLSGGARG
jgi:hypothetical protein